MLMALCVSVNQIAGSGRTFTQGSEVCYGGEAQQVKCAISVCDYQRPFQNLQRGTTSSRHRQIVEI